MPIAVLSVFCRSTSFRSEPPCYRRTWMPAAAGGERDCLACLLSLSVVRMDAGTSAEYIVCMQEL